MHDVLLGGNRPIIKQNDSVRVQCEATDCGALLEIEVPRGQSQPSLIVRCGNCNRLLSVWLNAEGRQTHSGETTLLKGSYGNDLGAAPMDMIQPRRTGVVETKQSPLTKVHLARPPPLSRAHGFSHVRREAMREGGGRDVLQGVVGNVASVQQLCGVYGISGSGHEVAVNTVTSDQRMGQCGLNGRDRLKSESSLVRKGSGGKIKKDRPMRHASPYNRFMSQEVKRIKAENPDVDHRKAFKMAASNWARSPTACQKISESNGSVDRHTCRPKSPASITGSNDGTLYDQNGISGPVQCKKEPHLMREGSCSGQSGRVLEEFM